MKEMRDRDHLVQEAIADANQFCELSKDGLGHCAHWWDCEPCCWCGDDEPNPGCDCERHTAEREAQSLAVGVVVNEG